MIKMIKEFLEWRKMTQANKKLAAKEGNFYLNSKTDTILLEKVIREINKNEDLTALFRTSDGTTLSLRVHKQPEQRRSPLYRFSGEEE